MPASPSRAAPASTPAPAATRSPVPAGKPPVNSVVAAAARQTQRVSGSTRRGATRLTRHNGTATARLLASSRPPRATPAAIIADQPTPRVRPAARKNRRSSEATSRAGRASATAHVGSMTSGAAARRNQRRLARPPAGQRGAVDEEAGVDEHARQDGDDEAGAAEALQRGEVGAAAVDQPAARTSRPRRCRGRRRRRWRGRTGAKPAMNGSMTLTPSRRLDEPRAADARRSAVHQHRRRRSWRRPRSTGTRPVRAAAGDRPARGRGRCQLEGPEAQVRVVGGHRVSSGASGPEQRRKPTFPRPSRTRGTAR